MADTGIDITAGSGTTVDTRTESTNGNHRQVVVVGDPSANAGVAPVDATAGLKVDLGADNDVTVTGTVTAELSATDNAVLDAIEVDTSAMATDLAAVETLLTTIESNQLPDNHQVTANLSATDNAVLDSIVTELQEVEADLEAIDAGKLEEATFTGRIGEVQASPTTNTLLGRVKSVEDKLDTLETTANAIQTAVEALDDVVSGSEAQVDIVSSALPTGASTSANQTTIIGHLDGVESSLTTTNTHLSEIEGAVETLETTKATIGTTDVLKVVIFDDNDTQITDFAGGSGSAAYSDSGGTDRKGLVDADRHVQVDVLSAPTTTVTATNLDIRDLTNTDVVTAELSATDNAVLDDIAAKLGTIDADTGNIATDVDTVASTVATIGTTPLQRMALFDASNNQITSFGGGTQYTEGNTDASITGTAIMFETNTTDSTVGVVNADTPLPTYINSSTGNPVGVNGGGLNVTIRDSAGDSAMNDTANSVKTTLYNASGDAINATTLGDGIGTGSTNRFLFTAGAGLVYNGTNLDLARGDATNGTLVNLGSNNDVTVTGTVTANLSATDNAVLDSIDASTQAILADTAAIQTAVEIIDNAISGSEMQVDVVGALPAGTNNIGDVDIASIAAGDNNIGNVDVVTLPAIPAGTNLIGRISASNETSTIYDGTTALTPKFAAIDVASSGDNTLVAAVTSKKIRVTALFLVAAGTVNARFESGAGGTALTGQMNLVANTGFVLPYNPTGWFETASNTLLNLELSGAVSVDGSLQYVEV